MKEIRAPQLPWLHRVWECPNCGARVEFELADATGMSAIKPKMVGGSWTVRMQCRYCREAVIYTTIGLVDDTGAGETPVGRAVADSGSLPAAPATEGAP